MKKKQPLVEHHLIYELPDQKKRQPDLTMFITEGEHTAITDVQYSTALNGRMMGWALIFEGIKKIIRSESEAFNKERGLSCAKPKKSAKASRKKLIL